MGKIEEKKQQKIESLLNSAFTLFTTNGFNKMSISDIVTHAGVAKGTFYLYFSDKFDLRNKVIAHQADRIFLAAVADLAKQDLQDFEDQVLFLVDHILRQFEQDKMLMTFMSKHLSWAFVKNTLVGNAQSGPGKAYLAFHSLLEHSGLTFRDPEIMLYMIIEFVSGVSYNSILYHQPVPLEDLKPRMHDVIRYIIRSEQISA